MMKKLILLCSMLSVFNANALTDKEICYINNPKLSTSKVKIHSEKYNLADIFCSPAFTDVTVDKLDGIGGYISISFKVDGQPLTLWFSSSVFSDSYRVWGVPEGEDITKFYSNLLLEKSGKIIK